MRPLDLHLHDFGSFHDAEIDLSEITLAAIVGENGAGKSTCLTAMSVALFGSAVAPLDGFVRQGAPGFRVDFTFNVSDVIYTVTREHGKAQKASLVRRARMQPTLSIVPGDTPVCEAAVRPVDAAIIALLGCDYAGFSLAHHLPQGALGAFAAMDPAKRKEWLMANLPMGEWTGLEARAKSALSETTDALRSAEIRHDALTEQIPDAPAAAFRLAELDVDAAAKRKAIALTEAALDKARKGLEQSRAAREAARVAQEAETAAERKVILARDDFNRVSTVLVEAKAKLAAIPKDEPVELTAYVEDEECARAALDEEREQENKRMLHEAALNRLRTASLAGAACVGVATAALKVFDAQEAPECPMCGQEVGGLARSKTHDALADALADAQTELDAAEGALRAHTEAGAALESHNDTTLASARDALLAASDALTRARARAQAAAERKVLKAKVEADAVVVVREQGRLNELGREHEAAQEASVAASAAYARASGLGGDEVTVLDGEKSLRALRETLSEIDREHATLTTYLDLADKLEAELVIIAAALVQMRERADVLALLVKAYGKGGIPARMIEGAVAEIEEFANDFLGRFSDGLTIAFATQRETKASTIRETLDVLVSDALGTRPIERFSGGERTRVNFAIAVGLSRFLAAHGEGDIDSFTVDEPDALDTAGITELVLCLHTLAQSVPFVAVVSHISGIADSMPQRIVVRKGASGSEVKVSA